MGRLSDTALARTTDPETSHAAAKRITGAKLSALWETILAELRACPEGLTVPELADRTRLAVITVSPRMKPMLDAGLVVKCGKRVPPGHKSSCIVWAAV